MNDPKLPTYQIVTEKDDLVAVLNDLQNRFKSGEQICVALRVFTVDGTWEDIVLGGTDEEQAQALANLRAAKSRAN
jgi:cupin superfamily acireductone dioxygenase involved in methionine salvage